MCVILCGVTSEHEPFSLSLYLCPGPILPKANAAAQVTENMPNRIHSDLFGVDAASWV